MNLFPTWMRIVGLKEEELREILQVHNTSAIFVTHDQTDALSLSDRVAVMTLSNGEGPLLSMILQRMYTQTPIVNRWLV